ncbi:MAG: holo-ACP synthase [Fusobacteriaceae bacterium]
MFSGIGNDIIEIERIKQALSRPGFRERVFTEKEIEEIVNKGDKTESYAGKFAAKEAVAKAFGTGVRGFDLRDVEILGDELGKPLVHLGGDLAEKYAKHKIELSISHCKEYAAAVAILFQRRDADDTAVL